MQKGKFTTNLKVHLKLEHADEFKEFQTEEKKKKGSKTAGLSVAVTYHQDKQH